MLVLARRSLAVALVPSLALAAPQGAPGEVVAFSKQSASAGLPLALEDGDAFGSAVASIGDLDGNGAEDLVVGAPGDDETGTNRGALWIVFRDGDGSTLGVQKINEANGFFEAELQDQDAFGSSLTYLGDIDLDGFREIAVGAPGDDGSGANRGAVYLISLRPNGTVSAFARIAAGSNGFTGGLQDGDEFGSAVAAIGDLEGNGVTELAVGAPGDDDGGPSRGAVWILFLGFDGQVVGHRKASAATGSLFEELLDDFDQFGNALAALGPLDASGGADLAVGAFGDDDGGPSHGAVWILFLATDGTVEGYQKISDTQGGFGGAIENGDAFGVGLAALADVDGNLVRDLAVGVLRDADGGPQRGAVWIVYLEADGEARGQVKISDTSGGFAGGLDDFDHFGSGLGAVGDLDGDGAPDLAVGAPQDDDGGTDRGALYTLLLEGRFLAAFADRDLPPDAVNPACITVVSPPRLGQVWTILANAGPGGGETVLIGQAAPLDLPIRLAIGDLALDPFAETLYVHASPIVTHLIPVPNLTALVGVVVYSQGLRMGPPFELCNAWDATVGY